MIDNLHATGTQTATHSPAELIERAQAMITILRARAERCELELRIPEESMEELHAAGVFNVVKPLKYG